MKLIFEGRSEKVGVLHHSSYIIYTSITTPRSCSSVDLAFSLQHELLKGG